MDKRKALITGITGQDGSYLAELLLSKGYDVIGIVRRNSVAENQSKRIEHIRKDLSLHYGDLTDGGFMMSIIGREKPHEIYNLGAQSHVGVSFNNPMYTTHVTGVGAVNVFEAVRQFAPNARVYQASSSEMFGNNIDEDGYQRETTELHPVSPYGCAKMFAHRMAANYRKTYDLHISCGILFNHESPRRGSNFVTAKVVKQAVLIKAGREDKLLIGNLTPTRDWGHAKDYVRAMWLMLQQEDPGDYVAASGESRSIQDLIDCVFGKLGLDPSEHVRRDVRYIRAEELYDLKGDSSKLRENLGWKPEYTFDELIDDMIQHWKGELQCDF